MLVRPIGVVRSAMTSTKNMPAEGAPAIVEVFPEYAAGLLSVESNSHVVVVTWLHKADRRTLQLDRVGPDNLPYHKGVFSLRSPSRPNPIGISSARLVEVEGRHLHLERLDTIDGTPVIDIKGYSLGWDAVFSARGFWDMLPASRRDPRLLFDLIRAQAVNFHGESCPGLLVGARMVYDVVSRWDLAPRDPALKFELGANGCVVDAIQGATGATFGNGRLTYLGGASFKALLGEKSIAYTPKNLENISASEALEAEAADLFEIGQELR